MKSLGIPETQSVNQSLSFAAVLVASFQPEETQMAEHVESVTAPENGSDDQQHEAAEPCPRLGSITGSG